MSTSFNSSYFHLLPNEILTTILSNVDTFDVLSFCEVYECDFFLQERKIIKNIDLRKKYSFQDFKSFTKKIVFEFVTILNINCLYWIEITDLRRFIAKLVNLETLYAIKTKLGLLPLDMEAYYKTKLKKLAVTMRKNDDIGYKNVLGVETLYIDLVEPASLFSPLSLETRFPNLIKLWVDMEEPCSSTPVFNSLTVGIKHKIFCKINSPTPTINLNFCGLRRYYHNRNQFYEMCWERFSAVEFSNRNNNGMFEDNGATSEAWKVLAELHCSKPYGPKDARRLYLNEATLENISFEELSFHHNGTLCNERCREAQKQILKSPSAKALKKLCIMMCVLQSEEIPSEPVGVQTVNNFKRKRMGVENSVSYNPVEEIFENFPNLQHLEVFACRQVSHRNVVGAYPLIAKFGNLQNLTLEIPVTVDGSFLIDVLTKCKLLKSLKLTSLSQHEKLNFNMRQAVPHGKSLKDLRFENHRIQMDTFLESLCLIDSRKLERLVLICNEIDKFSAKPLKQFLDLNPQLVFLYFVIRQTTDAVRRKAQETLNNYKRKCSPRIFLIKKKECIEREYPIPDVHFCEMIKFNSEVATLQPFDDVESF